MKIMETANQNELNSAKRMANMKLSRDLTCSGNDLQMVPCASSLGAQVRSFKRASLIEIEETSSLIQREMKSARVLLQ
jgi:hypothetical protein